MVDITKIAAIYADAERYGGMTVTVGGWAKTIRDLKTFGFIELNDGSCSVSYTHLTLPTKLEV